MLHKSLEPMTPEVHLNYTQIFSYLFVESTLNVHYKYRFVEANNLYLFWK
jgi:hypothetical protein